MEPIVVLGRGESLQNYRDYSHLFKKVYIVNDFNREIDEIGFGHFKNKEIVHVASRNGKPLSKKNYHRLKIKKVQTNAFKHHLIKTKFPIPTKTMPESMKTRGYEPYGWDKILNGETGKRKSPNKRCWPTTGLLAIDLALIENHPRELYLFGFDFYEKPYMCGQKITPKSDAKLTMMKQHLNKLDSEFDTIIHHKPPRVKENWEMVDTVPFIKRQQRYSKFNRMDIIARYLAIENHFGKNNFGWDLYRKMQTIRMKDNPKGAKVRKKAFIELIESVKNNGYQYNKPIRVKPSMSLVNGSHRLATALYFNVDKVLTWKDRQTKKKTVFNIKWFKTNGFKTHYIAAISKKAKELLGEDCI